MLRQEIYEYINYNNLCHQSIPMDYLKNLIISIELELFLMEYLYSLYF